MRFITIAFVCLATASGGPVWGMASEPPSSHGTAVHVRSSEATSNGVSIILAIEPPVFEKVKAKDGRTYAKVALDGCGNDNAYGHPALPIISYTLEIPWRTQAEVVVCEERLTEQGLDYWVYPHQPPVPKVPGAAGDPPFIVDESFYMGAKGAGFFKSLYGGEPVVAHFKKRGRQFVNVLMRPFAYDPVRGVLQWPSELRLDVTWCAQPLSKAAGPRLGNITVVDVTLRDSAQLDELAAAGYDIAGRKGNVVTLYATDAERAALQRSGYALRVMDQRLDAERDAGEEPGKALGQYHGYAALTAALAAYAESYPAICRMFSLGQSVEEREIWAVKITDNPDAEEDEPEVKYVSTMHGDEPIGTELCLYLIDLLLADYGADPRITGLVDETEIWIVPLMNPDGRESSRRYNADGYDLNRSFPDGYDEYIGTVFCGPPMDAEGRPPEVARIMEWSAAQSFVLSANLHTGALVVNYPYDNDGLGSVDSPTPDDLLFEYLSRVYSSQNPPMWNSPIFQDGISNGAAWYSISGGMQDWHYRYLGCNEVTIELSDVKWPPASELPQFWAENQEAMLAYFESAHMGVRGLVTDAGTAAPVYAAVRIAGVAHSVFTDPDVGDYHRQLLPGTYALVFSAPGYASQTIEGVIVTEGEVTVLDVALEPSTSVPAGVVVVAPESMRDAAAMCRAEKSAQGFDVFDVTLTGAPEAETVRGLIRDIYNAHAVDYVILLGDVESVPTFRSGAYSDLLYGLMDPGESFADYLGRDLLVGRVCVDTPGDVYDYVDKLASFVERGNHMDLTWVSHGSNDPQYDIAEGTHNWVIENTIPPGFHNELFYRDTGSEAALTAHIGAGTDGVVYSGHGSVYGWGRYNYNVDALANLTNCLDAPIVFGHCCLTGTFTNDRCFAEAWMETTARGIVYIGASDSTFWDEDDILEKQEFQAMADDPSLPIGDALAYGLEQVHAHYPEDAQYYSTIYHIFGDPTVALYGEGPLAIVTAPELPTAYVGEPYSVTLAAVGGETPYAWGLVGGALPAGLGLDGDTGTLSGTPTAVATPTFTVQVTDAALDTDTRAFSLAVLERFQIVTPAALPAGAQGEAYSVALTAQGGTPPYTWRVSGADADYEESDPGGAWLDGGTPQGWQGDDATWALALPWSFPYYGSHYTTAYVCTNGFIDFASSSTDYSNSDAELLSNVRVAPLWDDLVTNEVGLDIYVTEGDDSVVIRWQAETFSGRTPVNVEAVLFRDGDIQFNYGAAHALLTPTIGVSAGDGNHYALSARSGASSIPAQVSSLFSCGHLLPPGLDLDASGLISGVPTEAGLFAFTMAAEDAGYPQQTDAREFSLEVTGEGEGEGELVTREIGGEGTYPTDGGTVDVSVTFEDAGLADLFALSLSETIPEGWTYQGPIAAPGALLTEPTRGATGKLDFVGLSPPTGFPATLIYRLNVPAGGTQAEEIIGSGSYIGNEPGACIPFGPVTTVVYPDGGAEHHCADVNQDWRIDGTEVSRLIAFYSAGAYHVDASTPDGYAPFDGPRDGPPHHSDYAPQDWAISIPEISRLVTFYNAGGYGVNVHTPDGFEPVVTRTED